MQSPRNNSVRVYGEKQRRVGSVLETQERHRENSPVPRHGSLYFTGTNERAINLVLRFVFSPYREVSKRRKRGGPRILSFRTFPFTFVYSLRKELILRGCNLKCPFDRSGKTNDDNFLLIHEHVRYRRRLKSTKDSLV